jgi:ketosteroid isomerase-like protein
VEWRFFGQGPGQGVLRGDFPVMDVEGFEPQEWVASGDMVVSIGEFACRVRATGKRARTRWVYIWKFREEKVCSYEQFHDPALAEAFR